MLDHLIYAAALTIEFNSPTYSVPEGEMEDLIVELNRVADRDIIVMVTTSDGTAEGWFSFLCLLYNLKDYDRWFPWRK